MSLISVCTQGFGDVKVSALASHPILNYMNVCLRVSRHTLHM